MQNTKTDACKIKKMAALLDVQEAPEVIKARADLDPARQTTQQKELVFQLVGMEHETANSEDVVVLRGRSKDGQSVAVRTTGYRWSLYLQRHRSFGGPDTEDKKTRHWNMAAFLARLYGAMEANAGARITVPRVDDPLATQKIDFRYKAHDEWWQSGHAPVAWSDASGQCRTIYGWTPPKDRLQNLLRLYYKTPKALRLLIDFIDSDEFVRACPQDAPLRAFEGQFSDPMQQFRLDAGITMGGWVRIFNYAPEEEHNTIIHADLHYSAHWKEVCARPDIKENAPLRVFSFDIECAGKPDPVTGSARFPVAKWDAEALLNYLKSTYNIKREALPYGVRNAQNADVIRSWFAREVVHPWREAKRQWVEYIATRRHSPGIIGTTTGTTTTRTTATVAATVPRYHLKPARKVAGKRRAATKRERKNQRQERLRAMGGTGPVLFHPKRQEPTLPDEDDTDPCFMIVAVERRLGVDKALHFHRTLAFLLKHPEEQEKMDRGRHPLDRTLAAALPTSLPAQYSDIVVQEFDDEKVMIEAFARLIKEWQPDVLTGWNIEGFDLPYLYLRDQVLAAKKLGRTEELNGIIEGGHGGRASKPKSPPNLSFSLQQREGRGSWAWYQQRGSAAKGERQVLSIKMPYINMVDGLNVWLDTQANDKPLTLDHQSEKHLTYREVKEAADATHLLHGIDRVRVPDRFFTRAEYWPDGDTRKKPVQFPRRKLNVDVTKGGEYWKGGGRMLWFFLCYCYIDAVLPVHLLEDRSKLDYMIAMGSLCNLTFQQVFGGQQKKVFGNVATTAKRFHLDELPRNHPNHGVPHLIPDYGRRHLHWPDAWLQPEPFLALNFAKTSPRFKKKPDKAKGYEGAYNFDPHRGWHLDPIVVPDFTSLYPSLMIAYGLVYMGFLTRFMIKHYALPRYTYSRTVIGADGQSIYPLAPIQPIHPSIHPSIHSPCFANLFLVHCGESVVDAAAAEQEGYGEPELKECFWHSDVEYSILKTAQKKLFAMRKGFKGEMARWKTFARVLQYRDEFEKIDKNTVDSIQVYIDNGYWGSWFKRPFHTTEEESNLADSDPKTIWLAMVAEAMAALPAHITTDQAVAYAESLASASDAFQLACKIVLNSTYGAMGVPMLIAILPLMEIAASITSRGRHVIQMTSYIHESQRVPELRERSKAWKKRTKTFISTFEAMGGPDEVNCETLLLDPCREIHGPEDCGDASGNLHTHAGDTDSVMVGWPRAFLDPASKVGDVMDDAHCVSALVNEMMLDVMNIDPEKMSRMTLFHVKKNYVMDIVGSKRLLHKGNAVVKGEHIRFVKRQVGTLFDLLMRPSGETSTNLDIENTDALKKRLVGYLRELREELRQVALNEFDLSEFVIHKRLNKLQYDNPPEHAVVAQLSNKRGGRVAAGDRVSYGFVSVDDAQWLREDTGHQQQPSTGKTEKVNGEDKDKDKDKHGKEDKEEDKDKEEDEEEEDDEEALWDAACADEDGMGGGDEKALAEAESRALRRRRLLRTEGETSVLGKARDMVEDIQKIIEEQVPLNVEYYLENKMGGLLDPLAHILAPVSDYPHESQPKYRYNGSRLEKDRKKVQEWQRKRVKDFLYAPAAEEFRKRRRLLYRRTQEEENRKQGRDIKSLFTVLSAARDSRQCAFCTSIYEVTLSPGERQRQLSLSKAERDREAKSSTHVCPSCVSHSKPLERKMASQIEEGHATLASTEKICHQCIAMTDFDDIISPDQCRKYQCPVYEKRAATRIQIQNAERRTDILRRHVAISYDM